MFDGAIPPEPYRWVRPPADLAAGNQPPLQGTGSVTLTASGSEARSIPTGDGQAIVIFSQDGIAPREGESSVTVKVTPLDPGALAPTPPGQRADGNAYRIEAVYAASGQPVALRKPITVDLRYPIHAQEILRLVESGWKTLPTTRFEPSLTLVAFSDQLGVFVAAGPGQTGTSLASWWPYLAAAAGVLLAGTAVLLSRRRMAR
jgi:hypothetical protein